MANLVDGETNVEDDEKVVGEGVGRGQKPRDERFDLLGSFGAQREGEVEGDGSMRLFEEEERKRNTPRDGLILFACESDSSTQKRDSNRIVSDLQTQFPFCCCFSFSLFHRFID